MSRFRTAAVSAAVFVSLLTAAGIATAAGDDATPSGAPKASAAPSRDGARALCRHAPRMDRHIARALKRLNAGPVRRGSVDRLEKRVERAKAAGHDEIANYLENRLKFRRSLVPTLEQRRKDLDKVQEWCTSQRGARKR